MSIIFLSPGVNKVKRILLAACAVLALSSAADARRLPRDMVGSWCKVYLGPAADDKVTMYKRSPPAAQCSDDEAIEVTRDGYTFNGEDVCVFKNAKLISSEGRSIKERSANQTWMVQALCGGEGFPINQPVKLFFGQEGYNFLSIRE